MDLGNLICILQKDSPQSKIIKERCLCSKHRSSTGHHRVENPSRQTERAADMNRVDVSKLENLYIKCNTSETVSLFAGQGEDRFEFVVKHCLDAEAVNSIVSDVCCHVVDAETGEYKPELKDFYIRVAVLENYTNLTLPQDESRWRLVYGTPVFAMVTGHERRPVVFNGRDYDENMAIDIEQYEQILAAIDEKITYIIAHNAIIDVFTEKLLKLL